MSEREKIHLSLADEFAVEMQNLESVLRELKDLVAAGTGDAALVRWLRETAHTKPDALLFALMLVWKTGISEVSP